jgi:hypothetical protein
MLAATFHPVRTALISLCVRARVKEGAMSGNSMRKPAGRLAAVFVAASSLTGVTMTAGSVFAEPGGNSANAKQCKDWALLYREDGSTFSNRGDCTSHAARGGAILTEPPPPPPDLTPNIVTVDTGPAAGTYEASAAEFGPALTAAGVSGTLELVNDGTDLPSDGCAPLVGFPAGAIALIDRAAACTYVQQVLHAQAGGAVAVVIINDVAGDPTTLDGDSAVVIIPAVMVSQVDGATIKAGLPATGAVAAVP